MKISMFDVCHNCGGGGIVGGSEIGEVESCPECDRAGKLPSDLGIEVLELVKLFGGEKSK